MDKYRPRNVKRAFYKNTLMALLGVTRALAKVDLKPPTKWLSFFEGIRVSSDMLYVKLSSIDEEVGEEFVHKEELFEKKIGKEKFYSEEELDELKSKKGQIRV